jgi:F-type H+-transporting ATPase subunit a
MNSFNGLGIERQGALFSGIFLPPVDFVLLMFLLVLIECVSYNTRVFSLAIRLFANMTSGHILLYIFSGFALVFFSVQMEIISLVLAVIYALESSIAFLQGYVFLTLSVIYLNGMVHLH